MTFDVSKLASLYNRETVQVKDTGGNVLFTATVREISNGDATDAKAQLMADIDVPTSGSPASRKQKLKKELKKAMQSGVTATISLYEEVKAIESWDLTIDGEAVPITVQVWRELPQFISKQIADAIERLNPELDEDFRDGDGNGSTA